MSKHVSFPASHISAYEVGKRLQVITKAGAKIADTLTSVTVKLDAGSPRIFLGFANVSHSDAYGNGDVEVLADQYVKRIEDE